MSVGNVSAIAGAQVSSGVDVEMFMMQVSAERANNLESQMKDQINEVKARQQVIADITKFLNELSSAIKNLAKSDDTFVANDNLPTGWPEMLADYGIEIKSGDVSSDNKIKKGTAEGWIEKLKGNVDALNSQGQLDMIRLQSIMNKRNESFEQMTNMMQKFAKAKESIVGNMR